MTAPDSIVKAAGQPDAGVSMPLVMLLLISAMFLRSFCNVSLVDAGYHPVAAKNLSALAGFLALGILLTPLAGKVVPGIRRQFRSPYSWSQLIAASTALGVTMWLGQFLALAAIVPLSWTGSGSFGAPASLALHLGCTNPKLLLLAAPIVAIATPIIEEIIHRGMIFRSLLRHGKITATVTSAILFAVMHEPATIPSAFIVGILLALQLLHYRTLWAPIITHAVTNLLAVVSTSCVEAYWRPGVTSWNTVTATPAIATGLVACITATWLLATKIKIGAAPSGSTPT